MFEQDLAAAKGVTIRHWLQPKRIISRDGKVAGIELDYTTLADGRLTTTGETGVITADHVLKAIGQTFEADGLGIITLQSGRIVVDAERPHIARPCLGGWRLCAWRRRPDRLGRGTWPRCCRIDQPYARRCVAAGRCRRVKGRMNNG